MQFRYFQAVFTQFSHWPLDEDGRFYLCTRPLRLWDAETDKTTKFKSMREAWNYAFDGGKTVEAALSGIDRFELPALSGRKGGSGKMKGFKFSGSGDKNGFKRKILNAEANTRIKVKTEADAIKYFSDLYTNADHEYGMAIDEQGYVYNYIEGTKGGVAIGGNLEKRLIVHNHPGGGAFSDADLIVVSRGKERGIVAIGQGGDYYFRKKGGHFKGAKFENAVRNATLRGTDSDDAVRRWLTKNQKRYGYIFEFKKR